MGFNTAQLRALGGSLHARHIRTRQQGGLEIRYIEGWHAIREANRIFGYDGWSRETTSMSCIFLKPDAGRFVACYIARIRIEVSIGSKQIVREGTGLGQGTADTAGLAHEFAAKAAETDATKRALATFGARFGLELASNRGARMNAANLDPVTSKSVSSNDVGTNPLASNKQIEKPMHLTRELRSAVLHCEPQYALTPEGEMQHQANDDENFPL
jgi:DNA recombination protein Rad52